MPSGANHPHHYLLGYGSLLSYESRSRYSQITETALPVIVSGWQRSWFTRNASEGQCHVGAVAASHAMLNAVLVKIPQIDAGLREREKDYRFTQVSGAAIQLFDGSQPLVDAPVWICESLVLSEPDAAHPLMQTYLDTCLQGCLEAGGEAFAEQFLATTQGWNQHWHNDREAPRYPRRAELSEAQWQRCDALLHNAALLALRNNVVAGK